MAISFGYHLDGPLLVAITEGHDRDLQEVADYGNQLVALCRQHGCTRLLADERQLAYRLGTMDIYDLAKYYAEQLPRLTRAAVVCAPAYLEDAQFWEHTAVNRGLRVRVFTELEDALAWVKAE